MPSIIVKVKNHHYYEALFAVLYQNTGPCHIEIVLVSVVVTTFFVFVIIARCTFRHRREGTEYGLYYWYVHPFIRTL